MYQEALRGFKGAMLSFRKSSCDFHLVFSNSFSLFKNLTSGKRNTPKNVYLHPFTLDLNLTTSRRRTVERLFVNSDTRCIFLPRNSYQVVPLRRRSVSFEIF